MPVSEYSQNTDRTADVETEDKTPLSTFVGDHPELLQGLTDCRYVNATPIQVVALPVVIAGNDTIVEAKNGTGKTLTFVLPALIKLRSEQDCLQTVVLAPTREIAVQIQRRFLTVGQHLQKLNCEYFIGGTSLDEDKQKAIGCQIAVGCPGRIKQLLDIHVLKGSKVKIFVIDEVDKLFSDIKIAKDIRLINAKFPKIKQVVAVSASINKMDMSLFDEFMQEYSMVKGSENDENASEDPSKFLIGIKQYVACVKAVSTNIILLPAKNVRLLNILQNLPYTQCIVFTNYMTRVEAVCNMLRDHDYKADYIRGDQDQNIRLKLVDRLTSFKSKILVATDLIARGIDSSNVDLVINMDCPHDWTTYLHRIGRAGRFGNKGNAFTILDDDKELKKFKQIINNIGNVNIKMLPIAIEKPILEYADSEFEDLDLKIKPDGIEEENRKESTHGGSELKPKEIETNANCPFVDGKPDTVNKFVRVPDGSEGDSLQRLCQAVKETEKKLIESNMINKSFLTPDRTFVLFDPEPLLKDTDVNYSTQELILMMSEYSKNNESCKTEQNLESEKHEHKKIPGDQLPPDGNEQSSSDICSDESVNNNESVDTMLNTEKQTQNCSVSENSSGVLNYIPGTWTKEEFENKIKNANNTLNSSETRPSSWFTDHLTGLQDRLHNYGDTETLMKTHKPRFISVYDLFQIPDLSILNTTDHNNPESNSFRREFSPNTKYYQHLLDQVECEENSNDNQSLVKEGCEVEVEPEEASEIEVEPEEVSEDDLGLVQVSEGEFEPEEVSEDELGLVQVFEGEFEPEEESKFKMEPEEENQNDDECKTDGSKEKGDGKVINTTCDKDEECTKSLAVGVDKSVQTSGLLGAQESSATGISSLETELLITAETDEPFVNQEVLDNWYNEWKRQLRIIQACSKKRE